MAFKHRLAAGRTMRHIHVLEARVILHLLKRLARDGHQHIHVITFSDSRVVVGAGSKGRSSASSLNYVLRQISGCCMQHGFLLDLIWTPTWANPADAPSRGATVEDWKATKVCLPSIRDHNLRCSEAELSYWETPLDPSEAWGGMPSQLDRPRMSTIDRRCWSNVSLVSNR